MAGPYGADGTEREFVEIPDWWAMDGSDVTKREIAEVPDCWSMDGPMSGPSCSRLSTTAWFDNFASSYLFIHLENWIYLRLLVMHSFCDSKETMRYGSRNAKRTLFLESIQVLLRQSVWNIAGTFDPLEEIYLTGFKGISQGFYCWT